MPTDPTPAHWYTGPEFARLAHLIAAAAPDTAVGAFVRQFKGMSRCWRAVIKECPARTLGELVADSARIADLHQGRSRAGHARPQRPIGR